MSPDSKEKSTSESMTTATPAARPNAEDADKKVVTDSAQKKLDRKRANARLRQQRCRARKRAKMQQDVDVVTSRNIQGALSQSFCLSDITQSKANEARIGSSNVVLPGEKILNTTRNMAVAPRYWQPPPPPHGTHPKSVGPMPKLPGGPNRSTAPPSWKHPAATQPPHPYHRGAVSAHYYQHYAYGMAWYSWQQTAYYGQMHMQAQQRHPQSASGVSAISMNHQRSKLLPPASPLQPVSPTRRTPSKNSSPQASAETPYHQVEDMVKSPLRPLSAITSTPNTKDSLLRMSTASPESGLLPPLWSTVTKPTPIHSLQSPWSSSLASPPFPGSTTPATSNSKWNWAGFHETPSIPLTTPIKMSSDFGTWHSQSPPSAHNA